MRSRRFASRIALALLLLPRLLSARAGSAIGTDAMGRIYFVDTHHHVLWRVSPAGERTALRRGVYADLMAVWPDGTVYLAADDFTNSFRWRVTMVRPDGAARDTVLATDIAVDSGHTVGADTGGIYFQRAAELSQVSFGGAMRTWLYRLAPSVHIVAVAPTVAGQLAVLRDNAIYHSEADTLSPSIIGDSASGFVDMARGSARFDHPIALAVDAAGTMYVADDGNRRIRRVTYNGDASTLEHPWWPWRATDVALRGDTVYAFERADLLATARVVRVRPGGGADVVWWTVNWWVWVISTVVIATVLVAMTRQRGRRGQMGQMGQ